MKYAITWGNLIFFCLNQFVSLLLKESWLTQVEYQEMMESSRDTSFWRGKLAYLKWIGRWGDFEKLKAENWHIMPVCVKKGAIHKEKVWRARWEEMDLSPDIAEYSALSVCQEQEECSVGQWPTAGYGVSQNEPGELRSILPKYRSWLSLTVTV